MRDGKITTVIGRREQGKTLLAYTIFKNSKLMSFYVTPRIERCFGSDDHVFRTLDDFVKSEIEHDHNIFVFNSKNDYRVFFKTLKDQKNCNLFVDEASIWMSGQKVDEFISDLIIFTRPQNINLFFISVRPQCLSPLAISQSNLLIVFNVHSVRDTQYLEQSYGADFDDCRKLEKFNFYWYGEIDFLTKM